MPRDTYIPSFLDNEKPIVYISSAISLNSTSSFDYFVTIITELSRTFSEQGFNKELIIKVPKNNMSSPQLELFDEVIKNYEKYNAIIIAPTSSKYFSKHLKSNYSNKINDIFKVCPIFTIDKYIKSKINNISIPYVTSDWELGGSLAANKAYQYLVNRDNKKILIVQGKEGSIPRINGFKKFFDLRSSFPTPRITDKINFSREGAYEYLMDKYGKELDSFELFFCCNDEMALGAREALLELGISKEKKIIGFDGTLELKWHLNKKLQSQEHLFKTVDVRIQDQVKWLINSLKLYEPSNHSHSNLSQKIKPKIV
ncbi:sugar ABC transporter substrate-binding protein [Winogradskyella luteola]|uniref:Sugar ABC transporter substrate-binding protein n=1 Tax=Winogradskyella luteola TaxID=2828330 RepID=A0A9X1JS91_9FLAO|nr:sugar ABC transporter substrate-binding protein [Winogradskyella luteola]MBV7270698.1 sugar ABC transporter substrate-binding protein [Winogradskyella luteola]